MKPRVIICDDERLARERLVRLLEDIGGYELVGLAEHGEQAIELVNDYAPDIVLMDMRMPVMDGLTCARQLADRDSPPAIIFCTAFDEHALEAFSVTAAGYVLKPVNRESLREALARACRVSQLQLGVLRQQPAVTERSTHRSHITARTHRGIELIPIDEVRYFLADHKYVTVRHEQGEVLIDETLKELEEEFGDRFIRIHRNALLSLNFLEGLEVISTGQYRVRIRGLDERLVVSRRHLPELRETLHRV
ncbi:LytTR family two component transcriptional regulator [Paraperlucidibaca baekdonensis]|uniref:LytTR family two component transcriptional regulator n=1 Tax=Paraperlucidibaca baekdonensis TaxID=748120 RepID=A0A3E0H8H3_9GAMM|nr:LytTR family DNA-binding domain-containing protein [Paraperlucidibaca baekdonensis]REH40039.1 LytTR family two component transcriptional regulator [Paraperlucidibaca baekdonensis]